MAAFEKGQSGNPAGRPVGSRNKITKAYLDAIAEDFAENGVTVIESVRKEDPKAYLTLVSKLIPQDVHVSGSDGGPIEFSATERAARLASILTAGAAEGDRSTAVGGSPEVDATGGTADGGQE